MLLPYDQLAPISAATSHPAASRLRYHGCDIVAQPEGEVADVRLLEVLHYCRIIFGMRRPCIISIFRGIRFSRFEFGFVVRTLVRFHGAEAPTTNKIQVTAPFYWEDTRSYLM